MAATLKAVLRNGMTPICCVGETEDERDDGQTKDRLAEQVLAALDGLAPEAVGGWSSPTSRSGPSAPARRPPPEDAEDACLFIRAVVAKCAGDEAAGQVRIQYGGSVHGGEHRGA